jgi:hypothetical protein
MMRDKSRGTRGFEQARPKTGGLIAMLRVFLVDEASAEERSGVCSEVVCEGAEECNAGDLLQAADQDVRRAVMRFEARLDELAEARA